MRRSYIHFRIGQDLLRWTCISTSLLLGIGAISAQTFTEAELDRLNVEAISQVSELAPNLYMPVYGSRRTGQIYYRGIGTGVNVCIDGMTQLNRNALDIDLYSIASLSVLPGPGFSGMGNSSTATIDIQTINPFDYKGLRLLEEWGSHNTWRTAMALYHPFSQKFALGFDLNAYCTYGENPNDHTTLHYPKQRHKADQDEQYAGRLKIAYSPRRNIQLDNSVSFNFNRQGGYPFRNLQTGRINYNDTSFYNRTTVNDALRVSWHTKWFDMKSCIGFQYLEDGLRLDPDFTTANYLVSAQRQREWMISRNMVLTGRVKKYSWEAGLAGYWRRVKNHAPLTVKADAIAGMMPEHDEWDGSHFYVATELSTPSLQVAIWHRSRFTLDKWDFEAALRFAYDGIRTHYTRDFSTGYFFGGQHFDVEGHDAGTLKYHSLELLPEVKVNYRFKQGRVFAFFSKGVSPGGFNVDLTEYDRQALWTTELGTEISAAQGRFNAEATAFYIYGRDTQVMMTPGMISNGGGARSLGCEVSLRATPTPRWYLRADYGLADARFRAGEFKGNRLPQAPGHTLFASVEYVQPLPMWWFNSLGLMVNCRGAGPIYWDAANSMRQGFYCLPGASAKLQMDRVSLDLWATNLLNKRFHTLQFNSFGTPFAQIGQHRTLGITLRYIM